MKKNYIAPAIEKTLLNANQCILQTGSFGEGSTKTGEAKISFDNDEE